MYILDQNLSEKVKTKKKKLGHNTPYRYDSSDLNTR